MRSNNLWAGVCASLCLAGAGSLRAEEIKVDCIYSLTGIYAFAGVDAAKGVQLAIDDLNASGKLNGNTLKLNVYDDGSDRTQTLTLLNRAAAEGAIMVIGPTASPNAAAAGQPANDLKIPLLTNANTAEVLKPGPWTFKVAATSPDPIIPLAIYAVDKLHAKRVAFVYQRDNDGQMAFEKAFRDHVVAHGATVVADQTIVSADTDFSSIATKVAEAKPDLLYVGTSAAQAANVVVQAKQAGVAPNIDIMGAAGLGLEYIKTGGKAVDGSYSYADYDPEDPSPMNKAFTERYKKRFNEAPDNWAGLGYSAALIAGAAIEQAGPHPTRESVRAAMAGLHDVPMLLGTGKWKMDANRNPDYGMRVMLIKDGHFVSAP